MEAITLPLRVPFDLGVSIRPKLWSLGGSLKHRQNLQLVLTKPSPRELSGQPPEITSRFLVRLTPESSVVQSTYIEQTPEHGDEQDDDELQFEDVPYATEDEAASCPDIFETPTDRAELHSIRNNYIRQKLLRKLSEVNQHNRTLQRTLRETNDTILKCKAELATMEMELRFLIDLAHEIENHCAQSEMRKINGRYIHSHLASRLEDMFNRLALQIQGVDAVRIREIQLEYYGMAEDVRVMGSFDGWTEGEQLSPEHLGVCTRFSGIIKLRPGQYQIKFLVDGIWQVSPELPTVGEGLTANNLLTVE